MLGPCAAAFSDLAEHFRTFKFPSERTETLKRFAGEKLL